MQPCSRRSAVCGSRARHVKLNFCSSTESQQAACLEPIKSTTSVSLLILKSDVKTDKWQRFMSEVNGLLFNTTGLCVYDVYFHDDAALRSDAVRKHGIHVIQQCVRLTEVMHRRQPSTLYLHFPLRRHGEHVQSAAGYLDEGYILLIKFKNSFLSIQQTINILATKIVWLCCTDMLSACGAFEQCGYWLAWHYRPHLF